jgi:hypothetical protein
MNTRSKIIVSGFILSCALLWSSCSNSDEELEKRWLEELGIQSWYLRVQFMDKCHAVKRAIDYQLQIGSRKNESYWLEIDHIQRELAVGEARLNEMKSMLAEGTGIQDSIRIIASNWEAYKKTFCERFRNDWVKNPLPDCD